MIIGVCFSDSGTTKTYLDILLQRYKPKIIATSCKSPIVDTNLKKWHFKGQMSLHIYHHRKTNPTFVIYAKNGHAPHQAILHFCKKLTITKL